MRRRVSVAAMIWGLLFCFVAGLAIVWSAGVQLSLTLVSIIVPVFLIGLGGLGIALSRRN